ncbi:MAG TPA: alpha/beta fold hydrolase [Microbacterium sp.]|nr:alpha/beta fold hydrolase [Microbacterium sp.]
MTPPLVLLAGMNCTADLWADCGFDAAVCPELDRDSIDDQVRALLADLPETFVLVGHSLGAIVAMALTAREPERVAALCVSSTNAKAPTAVQLAGWRAWLDAIGQGGTPRELQAGILDALLSAGARGRPDIVERALAMGDDTGPGMLAQQLRLQSTRIDLRPALRGLRVPTLVIAGTDDGICPPDFHREIAAEVPDAELIEIAGGHLLPLESPLEFAAAVESLRARVG